MTRVVVKKKIKKQKLTIKFIVRSVAVNYGTVNAINTQNKTHLISRYSNNKHKSRWTITIFTRDSTTV